MNKHHRVTLASFPDCAIQYYQYARCREDLRGIRRLLSIVTDATQQSGAAEIVARLCLRWRYADPFRTNGDSRADENHLVSFPAVQRQAFSVSGCCRRCCPRLVHRSATATFTMTHSFSAAQQPSKAQLCMSRKQVCRSSSVSVLPTRKIYGTRAGPAHTQIMIPPPPLLHHTKTMQVRFSKCMRDLIVWMPAAIAPALYTEERLLCSIIMRREEEKKPGGRGGRGNTFLRDYITMSSPRSNTAPTCLHQYADRTPPVSTVPIHRTRAFCWTRDRTPPLKLGVVSSEPLHMW